MIPKIPVKEIESFLTASNKKKYPNLWFMFNTYYERKKNGQSQYIIK